MNMNMHKYDNDIIEYWHERMPHALKELANKALHDLYCGPSYYDGNGDEVSCFDEDAIAFEFLKACKEVGAWCEDSMHPLYLDAWCGMLEAAPPEQYEEIENDEGEVEEVYAERSYYEWDVRNQMKILFGELASYL